MNQQVENEVDDTQATEVTATCATPRSKYQVSQDLHIELDPRSHLEVADEQHRYGKNLRLYFQHFVNIEEGGMLANQGISKKEVFRRFFEWLKQGTEVIAPKTRIASFFSPHLFFLLREKENT